MLKLLSTTGLAATLAIGSMIVPAGIAHAQDVQLQIGPDGLRVYDGNRDRDDNRYREVRRGCDAEDAEDAARDAGLRRAHVVSMTRRAVVVEGMTRGGPDRIVFANVRGCPEIG
ncbi:hypothetical protein [Rhizobium sp. BK251]|uniref:hypothetical protein n=1 Tax=Rhizobium sp. BK251 TaxID=2512125 RepID=UPI00104670B2|nr:hypothetical protein [Rhizobium sp. BK251]TCL74679.1 hypothetical protein EV286_102240 [Rhizobium sp. BK251]